MSRSPRIVVPGVAHHVTQRGNYRQQVFDRDEERRCYLDLLRDACDRYGVRIWAYCLMPNHVHLILVPAAEDGLARVLDCVQSRYSLAVHQRDRVSGHLWQNRYYSCFMDEFHLVSAMRYVERNPVRAGLVANAWDYQWSSARAHVLALPTVYLDPGCPVVEDVADWAAFLSDADNDTTADVIRSASLKGRPAAGESFIKSMEERLGTRLLPRPVGRPRRCPAAIAP